MLLSDGYWYNCVIDKVLSGGRFRVTYDGYGNTEVVHHDSMGLREGDSERGKKRGAPEDTLVCRYPVSVVSFVLGS